MIRQRFRRASAWLGVVAILLGLLPGTVGAQPADYAITGGRFFTQTANGGNGFSVVDAGTDAYGQTIRFWTEFQRLGGVTTLGYPASRRFVGSGGFTYQLFQRGALQWRPERNGALLSNIFQWFQDGNRDPFLKSLGVPEPIADDGSNGNYQAAVQTRMGWMTDAAIRRHFLSSPNSATIRTWNQDTAIELYGLPMSRPERSGPFIVQRFQRIAFQLWVEDVSGMPAKGSVVGILGGDLLKQSGIVGGDAIVAEGPGGTAPAAGAPTSTPIAAAATATPVAAPTATPVPAAATAWRFDTPKLYKNCGTTYVYGKVKDQAGNPVNGISVRSWNDWGNVFISGSGSGGREAGYWDRIIGSGVRAGTWYAAVIDGAGTISSPVAVYTFTDSCAEGGIQQIELDFIQN